MDLVEMPGQFTRRGGILDIYSPEADRPMRIEFFGDEIETIRKFDPETQRSQSGLDEAQLLPLTETPVTEHLLAAVHARLSKQRVQVADGATCGRRRDGHRSGSRGRRQRLSRLGVLLFRRRSRAPPAQPACRAACSLSKSLPWCATRSIAGGTRSSSATSVPASARSFGPRISTSAPKFSQGLLESHHGLDLDQLGAIDVLDEDNTLGEIARATRAPRCAFTAPSLPLIDQLKNLMAAEQRIVLAAPTQGDVERTATMLREYQVPYRLGSRVVTARSGT